MNNAREKTMSKMTSWSIEAEALWRAASVNEATGRAKVGSGIRVTVRSRDARAIVRCVVGKRAGVWFGYWDGGTGLRFRFLVQFKLVRTVGIAT